MVRVDVLDLDDDEMRRSTRAVPRSRPGMVERAEHPSRGAEVRGQLAVNGTLACACLSGSGGGPLAEPSLRRLLGHAEHGANL